MKKLSLLIVALWAGLAHAAVTTPTSSITYTCTGAATAFPVTYPFLASGDLVVTPSALGAPLTLGTQYTVTGAGGSSGAVTLASAGLCAAGTLTIERVVALTQPVNFRAQGAFSPRTHETAFDRLTMGLQQTDKRIAAQEQKELRDVGNLASINVAGSADPNLIAITATGSGVARTLADQLATLPDSKIAGRTLAAHFSDVLNIKDAPYNAVGDGTTDDTTAIQAAVTDAASRTGTHATTVFVPAGTYKITSGIVVSKDIQFIGEGPDATIFNAVASSPFAAFTLRPAGGGYIWGARFAGFRINGDGGAAWCDGIVFDSTSPSAISLSKIEHVRMNNVRDGLVLTGHAGGGGSNSTYHNHVTDVKIVGVSRRGVWIDTAVYNTLASIEVTGVASGAWSFVVNGGGTKLYDITTDGVADIDAPWGKISSWTTEAITAATPVAGTVLRLRRLQTATDIAIIGSVPSAGCDYGVVAEGDNMVISNVRHEPAVGGPHYPLALGAGSSGTVVNWKGAGTFKMEVLGPSDGTLDHWQFVGSPDLTDMLDSARARVFPTASIPYQRAIGRGTFIIEDKGGGVDDALRVTVKKADGTYSWATVTITP